MRYNEKQRFAFNPKKDIEDLYKGSDSKLLEEERTVIALQMLAGKSMNRWKKEIASNLKPEAARAWWLLIVMLAGAGMVLAWC